MSIRQKFITLLILIGLIPLVGLVLVISNYMNGVLLDNTKTSLHAASVRHNQRLSSLLQVRQRTVVRLVNQFNLQQSVLQHLDSPTPANLKIVKGILDEKLAETPELRAITLVGTNNRPVASTATSGYVDAILPQLNTKQLVDISMDVVKDPVTGEPLLNMMMVLNVNLRPAGVISAQYRSEDVAAIFSDYTGLGSTGEVYGVDDATALFPLRFNKGASLKQKVTGVDLSETFVSGVQLYEGTDYKGRPVYYTKAKADVTGWIMISQITKEEAGTPITVMRNTMITFALISVMLTFGVAIVFARIFTNPIAEVSRVAQRIGRGDLLAHTNVNRRRTDEIGVLARSVDAMGTNLHTMVGSIEYQRRRLRTILDSTTEGIFAIDGEDKVVLANQAVHNLIQKTPDEVAGKSMHELFGWRHGLQSFTVDYKVSEVHTYSDMEYVDSDGTQRYVKVIVAPVADSTQRETATAIVTIHDETSMHDLENMKADFVSMAAHELRTPLTAVRGYLQIVSDKLANKDNQDVEMYTNQALTNVTELGTLINNLLDVSRIERGTLTLNMGKVNLLDCIARVLSDNKFGADERQVKLNYHTDIKEATVVGDNIALKEVVNNLVTNAIKYTMPKGSVTVSFTKSNGIYSIAVTDTGVGIPKAAQQHLFTKFYRVHSGLDSGSTGTGLGLFIAKSIVERHKGTITVESQEGVGSTFTVTVPEYSDELMSELQPNVNPESEEGVPQVSRRKRGWITKNVER